MHKPHVNWQKSFAELVTIAVGIALGLAANDWRDSVRDRSEARAYEARLDEAVASDLKEYARAAALAAGVDSAAVDVLAVYRGREVPEPQASQFLEAVLRASWMPPPALAHDTYDDLVSTGGLRLLPVGIRAQLRQYYGQAQMYGEREQSFKETLSTGYWRVPAMVLGPELLPRLWKAMADPPSDQRHVADRPTVSAHELGDVVARLRRVSDLETQIADVRHVMIQREVIYADRMTAIAGQLRQRLAAPR